jgi:hypothetical protein
MNHRLFQTQEFVTGATEWGCLLCSYRAIINKTCRSHVVLDFGDIQASHSCGNVEFEISPVGEEEYNEQLSNPPVCSRCH